MDDVTDVGEVPTPRALPGPPAGRSRADAAMARLLLIPADAPPVAEDAVNRVFNVSILLSALRCLLSYVVFPIVTPLLGAARGVGPALGIPIAVLALTFDVLGIRRFWLARHRWRWAMTGVYLAVMVLVTVLLVQDVVRLAA